MKKPSNYISHPIGSITRNSEHETIARIIMEILADTGDTFRIISYEEFYEVRVKQCGKSYGKNDGGAFEKKLFETVLPYCITHQGADLFCKDWYKE